MVIFLGPEGTNISYGEKKMIGIIIIITHLQLQKIKRSERPGFNERVYEVN